jgi:hypothetical protein
MKAHWAVSMHSSRAIIWTGGVAQAVEHLSCKQSPEFKAPWLPKKKKNSFFHFSKLLQNNTKQKVLLPTYYWEQVSEIIRKFVRKGTNHSIIVCQVPNPSRKDHRCFFSCLNYWPFEGEDKVSNWVRIWNLCFCKCHFKAHSAPDFSRACEECSRMEVGGGYPSKLATLFGWARSRCWQLLCPMSSMPHLCTYQSMGRWPWSYSCMGSLPSFLQENIWVIRKVPKQQCHLSVWLFLMYNSS